VEASIRLRMIESSKNYAANILVLRRLAGRLVSQRRNRVTIAERLGFGSKSKLLIINADDFGLCTEQNLATADALRYGIVNSASIMVPTAGFKEACAIVRAQPVVDLGVHLTLNSEWQSQRWGPVLDANTVPSLVDDNAYFWPTRAQTVASSRAEEVEAELRAQIEAALAAGIDVTHLDSHMFSLNNRRSDLLRVYLRLAYHYRLPVRAARVTLFGWQRFYSLPDEADQLGILYPDHFAVLSRIWPSRTEAMWAALLRSLPAGLTEVACHPAYAGGKLAQFAGDIVQREADLRCFLSNTARRIIRDQGIQLVGYRLLRDAMRSRVSSSPTCRTTNN
jgi:chitin disaccharide deacetylase